jgi:hypothetical protein
VSIFSSLVAGLGFFCTINYFLGTQSDELSEEMLSSDRIYGELTFFLDFLD